MTVIFFGLISASFAHAQTENYSLNTSWQFAPLSSSSNLTSIAVDSSGYVYLADYDKNLIEKFTTNGTLVTEWAFESNQYIKVGQAGIAVDPSGNVYVVEGWDQIIEKFTPNNLTSYSLNTSWTFAPLSSSGNLTSIAVDSSGYVYLADYDKNLIEKFTTNGTLVTEWAFENNQYIKVGQAGIAVDPSGNVYVVEGWDQIIEKFTPNNLTSYSLNTSWTFAPLSSSGNLTSIAVDSSGYVYLADYDKNLIEKFTTNGTLVTEWAFENNQYIKVGQAGIAVDPSGNVYVVEGWDQVIEKFTPLVANFTNETNNSDPLTVQFNDTSTGNPTSWYWDFGDGTNSTDENPQHTYAESGEFQVTLTIKSSTSSATIIEEIDVHAFRPYPNGYKFRNFPDQKDLGLTLGTTTYQNVYGEIVNPNNKWSKITNFYNVFFKNKATGPGNCFGFAATSLLLYNSNNYGKAFDYSLASSLSTAWNKGFNKFYNPSYIPDDIQHWIMVNQAMQFDQAIQDSRSQYTGLRNIYDVLKQHIDNNNYDFELGILGTDSLTGEKFGHALVPYKIDDTQGSKAIKIYVYDCNHPGEKNWFITLNLDDKKVGNYDSNNINSIRLVSLDAIKATPVRPLWFTWLSFVKSENAHILFTDNSGNKLGYDQGVFKDEINDTCPMMDYQDDNNSSSQEVYYVPDTSIKMEIYGNGSGDSETSMMTPNGLITAYVPVTPTSVDQFKILNNGTGIEFIPENGTAPSLGLMLDVENSDNAQIVNTSISPIEVGGSVNLSNDNGNITIQNIGLARTCNMSLEQVTSDQNSSVSINNIEIYADSTVHVVPSNWNDIANSTITIYDVDSSGTVYYSKIVSSFYKYSSYSLSKLHSQRY